MTEDDFYVEVARMAHGDTPWASGYLAGAAAVFGLMGMAEAIKSIYLCRDCGGWEGYHVPRPGMRCQCWNDE